MRDVMFLLVGGYIGYSVRGYVYPDGVEVLPLWVVFLGGIAFCVFVLSVAFLVHLAINRYVSRGQVPYQFFVNGGSGSGDVSKPEIIETDYR